VKSDKLLPIFEALGLDGQEAEQFEDSFEDLAQTESRVAFLAEDPTLRNKPEILRQWLRLLPRLPDPDEALNQLVRVLSCGIDTSSLVEHLEVSTINEAVLTALVAQSPFLCDLICSNPEYLFYLFEPDHLDSIKRWPDYRREIESLIPPERNAEDAAEELRAYHRREILRIAVRDILGFGSILACALELSNLADNIVFEMCHRVQEDFRSKHGRPLDQDRQEARFAVIALGKLGGRELNFSSDIDLIFVYDGEGRAEKTTAWSNFEYFAKLAAALVNHLSASTGEGSLYRVDTRLRPEGTKGALARSLPSIELYYESWGENWERQAMLKARPIGGDPGLGEQFMKTIKPFTYRKYVDPISIQETLQNIVEMRHKTIRQSDTTGRVRSEGRNFKTGAGGIRDVEFIVQAIQMLYGGQYPEIRLPGTINSLRRIRESGLLSEEDYQTLVEGYQFLRRVEHRVQMEQERQIYTLPGSKKGREVLSRRLGYKDQESFLEEFDKHTRGIHKIFQGVFAPFEKRDLLDSILDPQAGNPILKEAHLHDKRRARKILERLAKDPENPHLNPKIRRLFRKILPRLLEDLKDTPSSERALGAFERIVTAVGARSAFYSILAGNPNFLSLLMNLGSHSKYLTEILVSHPALLDRLGSGFFLQEPITREHLEADHHRLEQAMSNKDPIDRLRRLKQTATLKTGLRYLLRFTTATEMSAELSSIAEYVLEQLLEEWLERYREKYGSPLLPSGEPCGFAIIAMGKLGGGEIGWTSDLDLLYVYQDDAGVVHPGDGGQPRIGVKEFYVRLAQDLQKCLMGRSSEGTLYEADSRLRPYGRGGDLAGTLQQYREYYERDAHLWERQTLTRARWIAGNRETGERFLEQVSQFVYGKGLSPGEKKQIAEMRSRIERQKKGEPLKAGEGGLVDVEFLVQALQMEHGGEHPEVRSPNIIEALEAMVEKQLIDAGDARTLIQNYLFQREIANRLQILDGISISQLPKEPEKLEELVRRMYHLGEEAPPSNEEFIRNYENSRKEIRALFNRYLGIPQGLNES
jgi:[glutamine synthetase] adenylyltransferase / [glutamine synthetase]-adenylyl-L-tyrosine phosphorylase